MAERAYLAIDLGASSGRLVAGAFDGERLRLEEVHRFANGPVAVGHSLHWDVLRLWSETLDGLRVAADRCGKSLRSVGVDTWGVDFALLGRGDELLSNPHHYRDRRTDGMPDRALEIVSRDEIFAQTGLQFLPFNTLYQLLAMKLNRSVVLEGAETLLMMPDLFHWLLTGAKSNELTDATTTQFYDPQRKAWATDLLDRFGLPSDLLGEIVPPGTNLGKLRNTVARDTGLADVDVVLPGTHDTASAVMAVPAEGTTAETPDWCYISSGTWSLMGVELSRPVISETCRELNFTNEGGVGGTVRLLKNIAGLWLVQECRRVWNQQGQQLDWEDLNRLAREARPLASLVDPDAPDFLAPSDMPAAIRDFCRRSDQPVPENEGAVVRCALDSIAMKSRFVLSRLEQLTGGRLETVHIMGGGAQNRLLCQATADACGRRVVAGPIEATAIGNIMMQAVADGALGSIAEARQCIRRSFPVEEYEPQSPTAWDEAYGRFERLSER